MTYQSLSQWRRELRDGELPPELVAELRGIARLLVARTVLPAAFAPYGVWDDEAADEVFAGWYADRLVKDGQLLAMLDRSRSIGTFRAIASRSLRQHVLNSADRSQARNLYARLTVLLDVSESVFVTQESVRPGDRWFALASDPRPPWTGPERALLSHAWALGDFTVIRYKAAAAKLSPVLDQDELARFVLGLLGRTQASLTPRLIMFALSERFALGEVSPPASLDVVVPQAASSESPADVLHMHGVSEAVWNSLSARQQGIVLRPDDTVAELSAAFECSVGTIVNERRRIVSAFARLSSSAEETRQLMKITRDAGYPLRDA